MLELLNCIILSLSSANSSVANTAPVLIGRNATDGNQYFGGNLSQVGIWQGALTQAQVKSIMWKNYASLTDSEKTNLVSWWNLDSTVGTGIGDDATNVFDNHYARIIK